MEENDENVPPGHELYKTSTPINITPVKHLPALPHTPVIQEAKITSGQVCFICSNAPQRLRCVVTNAAFPDRSPVLKSLRECFSLHLKVTREHYSMKICMPCKNALEKAVQFKDRIALAVTNLNKVADDSLGCSVLPSSPECQTRTKRLVPSDSTPTSSKTERKKKCSGESRRSLSFGSSQLHKNTQEEAQLPTRDCDASSQPQADTQSSSSSEALSLTRDSFEVYKNIMSGKVIEEHERKEFLTLLKNENTTECELAKVIYESSFMQSVQGYLIREVNTTMVRLCSQTIRPGPTVLRTLANPSDLQEKDILSEAAAELRREQPFLCRLLTVLCDPPGGAEQKPNTHHVIAMIYGMMMYNRNRTINALQKMNTAAAIRYHVNNDLLEIFHRCGVTLASSYKLGYLEKLGQFNTSGLVRRIEQRELGKVTVDNIDWRIRAWQMRLNKRDDYIHYTASTYYPDRILREELAHFSTFQPPVPEMVDPRAFFITEEEEQTLKRNYGYQIGRLLVRFCPELKWMEKCIPTHIPHDYSEIVARKSEIFPLRIILEDPKYQTGMIRALIELVALLKSCYEEAGQLDDFENIVIPLGGDQLVRLRTTGARDVQDQEDTREERLEPVFPELIEFFHIQQDYLEKLYLRFYKPGVMVDECSLPFFKLEIDRKDINGKVKGNFQAHNDFMHTVGSSLLLKLAMDKMGMEEPEDKPNVEGLPENVARMHTKGRSAIFEQMVGNVVNKIYKPFTPMGLARYVEVNVHVPGRGLMPILVTNEDLEQQRDVNVPIPVGGGVEMRQVRLGAGQDDVTNYALQLLQWHIHLLEFEDAIREGDLKRCNICIKMLIPFFYSHSSQSNYAIECIDYILKTEILLPAALAIRCRLASFINTHGGPGGNKPADMQQENNICVLKEVVKGLGAGKTPEAIVRASLAAPVTDSIANNYKKILGMHLRSGHHPNKSDEVDVRAALTSLAAIRPFAEVPGRRMAQHRHINLFYFSYVINLRRAFLPPLTVKEECTDMKSELSDR